jgi:glycosyltransferase involved in cell wall biosynthesis
MAKPLVSILLPSLNARQFLEARVDSLFQQTCSDWEAIVLDSQSTDGTWEFFSSIAAKDSRFHLHQIPRDGLYAALNRGFNLAVGEFIHVATCDDSMASEFLARMLAALEQCPNAGLAACDAQLINRNGDELAARDLAGQMSRRAMIDLLGSSRVRTVWPQEFATNMNYRPIPHDCLLHFGGRSVYLSLNQLLVRMTAVKAAGIFETGIGSVADFGWLLRLTNQIGTVHIPEKLAQWRFHGDQLSVHPDDSRLGSMERMCSETLQHLEKERPLLLTANDRVALLLPVRILLARSVLQRTGRWLESFARLLVMLVRRPAATWRALVRVHFRFGTRRYSLLPMIFEGIGLDLRDPNQKS